MMANSKNKVDMRKQALDLWKKPVAELDDMSKSLMKSSGLDKLKFDRAKLLEPFGTLPPLGSINPIDLWKWMDRYEEKTAGQVLAIAHNGNLSNGIMFPEAKAYIGICGIHNYKAFWNAMSTALKEGTTNQGESFALASK